MKGKKSLLYLGSLVILIAISLIGISLKEKSKNKIKVSAERVHATIAEGQHYYEPEQLQKELASGLNDKVVIDLRSPNQYIDDKIEGAINIPYQRILDDEFASVLSNNKNKILYSDEEDKSAEIWVLLTQMGYQNFYILKGGLNYWIAKVEKKDVLRNDSKELEKPKYDFKKEISPEEGQ